MKMGPQKVLNKHCNYYIMCNVLQRDEHCVGSTSGAVEKCVGAQSHREVGSDLNPGTLISPHSH